MRVDNASEPVLNTQHTHLMSCNPYNPGSTMDEAIAHGALTMAPPRSKADDTFEEHNETLPVSIFGRKQASGMTTATSSTTSFSEQPGDDTTAPAPVRKNGKPYAAETARKKQKAADILISGEIQDPPCTNCESRGLVCKMDTAISNLCHYCVAAKKVCSANPKNKSSKRKTEVAGAGVEKDGIPTQQGEKSDVEVVGENFVARGKRPVSQDKLPEVRLAKFLATQKARAISASAQADTLGSESVSSRPEAEVINISLVRGQTARTIDIPAGNYAMFPVNIGGMLRYAVLLPERREEYGVPAPRDEHGVSLIPTPILRSVVPGRIPKEDD